jgi:capsular polysaccharide biosynthesis protein
MTFWDFIQIERRPSPFTGCLAEIGSKLNSSTPFSRLQLDMCWYEYEPVVLDIQNPILLRYSNQYTLAGINNAGTHERVLFKLDEYGALAPADVGNELHWKTNYAYQDLAAVNINEVISSEPSIAYAGVFFYSFGHFILENLPRLYLLAANMPSGAKTIFVNLLEKPNVQSDFEKTISISPNYKCYLESIGIERIIRVPSSGIRSSRAKVAAPTISLTQTGLHISSASRLAWQQTNNILSSGIETRHSKLIYLSRSRVKAPYLGRQLLNEEEVEKLFVQFGFEVVSSESLNDTYGPRKTEKYKHAILRDAEVVAGTAGSNLINHVFCKSSTKILLLSNWFLISHQRNAAVTHSIYLANYMNQDLRIYLEESSDPVWECDIAKLASFLERNL